MQQNEQPPQKKFYFSAIPLSLCVWLPWTFVFFPIIVCLDITAIQFWRHGVALKKVGIICEGQVVEWRNKWDEPQRFLFGRIPIGGKRPRPWVPKIEFTDLAGNKHSFENTRGHRKQFEGHIPVIYDPNDPENVLTFDECKHDVYFIPWMIAGLSFLAVIFVIGSVSWIPHIRADYERGLPKPERRRRRRLRRKQRQQDIQGK